MRICYLGDPTHIHDSRFLKKMIEKGYDVHVVTLPLTPSGKNPVELKNTTYYKFPHVSDPSKYPKYVCDVILLRNIFEHGLFLRALIRKIEPDILHAGWVPIHGASAAICNFHPFLLMPWGSDVLILPKETLLLRWLTRFVIKRADMITCDAEFVKQEIIKLSNYPADKIVVFPWGIDLEKFNPDLDDSEIREKLNWKDKKILIMTRLFKPIYNIKCFLNALPEIIKEVPDTRVILCGNGPLEDEFKSFVMKNKLNEYVHFAGFVRNDELPKYYGASDIYVSCSLCDGTSLSLLEAMACGLPTVVTDVRAIMEWVRDGENGFVVPRKDPKKLAEKVIQLLKDEEMRKKFGNFNMKIAKERADWTRNFKKLEKTYEDLCKATT